MPNVLNRHGPAVAAAAAVILTFAATWFLLDRTERRPRWAVVEAPATAVVGEPYEVRVTLAGSVEPTEISCTLHRANAERRGWGYLASAGPARPAVGGGTYTFVFTVPEKAETSFVFVLVFLSPTGRWDEGTRAVASELRPVGRSGSGMERRQPERLAIRHYPTAARAAAARALEARPRPERRPSPWVHPVLAGLLLAAALGALRAGRGDIRGRSGPSAERTVWLLFAAALAVCAVVEVSGFAGEVAALGRRWAQGAHVYEYRRPVQKTVMAAAAAASLGLFFLFIRATRRPGPHRALWWAGIGLADYLVLSFVGALSFHAVDVVRGWAWLGVSPFDAVRGAGVLATLAAGLLAARPDGLRLPT